MPSLEIYKGCKMNAVIENNPIMPLTLKLQKQISIFNLIVGSFSRGYFCMADVLDLESLSKLTIMMREDEELMRLNNPDSKPYAVAAQRWLMRSKQALQYKNALRISPTSRFQPGRSSSTPTVDESTKNNGRDVIVNESPWDSGIPASISA